MFGHSRATGELDNFEFGMVDNVLHILVGAVEEVDIVQIETAVAWKTEELFHDYWHSVVAFHQRSIAGDQGSEKLKSGDFNGEVERGYNANIAERPSVACWGLPVIVSCYVKRLLEEPGVVSSEVFEESSGDDHLSSDLLGALGHDSLGQFDEIFFNFWFSHFFCYFHENLSEFHVSVDISDGVVQSKIGNFPLRGHIGIEFSLIDRQAVEEEVASIEGVNDRLSFGWFGPFSIEKIFNGVGFAGWDLPGVNGGPLGDIGEAVGVSEQQSHSK